MKATLTLTALLLFALLAASCQTGEEPTDDSDDVYEVNGERFRVQTERSDEIPFDGPCSEEQFASCNEICCYIEDGGRLRAWASACHYGDVGPICTCAPARSCMLNE